MAIVTFIGGSADMTRRVMDVQSPVFRVARLPRQLTHYGRLDDMAPVEALHIDTYRLRQVGAEHYVATWSDLR